MSNTRKPTGANFKTWDQYVKEAEKPPFVLHVSEDRKVEVPVPTGQQVIDAQRLAESGDIEKQLRTLCGPAEDEILELVKAAPGGAITALVTDIMAHFGYDVGEGSSRT